MSMPGQMRAFVPSTPASSVRLYRLMQVLAKRKASAVVELLMACPPYRITHGFYFKLCMEPQSFKLRTLWQHKLRLANFAGQWITWIETTASKDLVLFALDSDPQDAWYTSDAIIGKANYEAQITRVLIAPNKGRPYAITDMAIDMVKRDGISLVISHQVSCADLMKIPKGPVIRSDVHDVSDHVLCRRDAFYGRGRIRRFARQALLEQGSYPGRPIAE